MKQFQTPLLLAIMMIIGVQHVFAQESVPRNEFKLGLDEPSLVIQPGQELVVELKVIRSKQYQNKEISLRALSVPEYLTIEFAESRTRSDVTTVRIAASEQASAGKYTLLIQGKSLRLTKGITLGLTVTESTISKN